MPTLHRAVPQRFQLSRIFIVRALSTGAALLALASPAHALFEDDEARRAILELRKEIRERDEQRTKDAGQKIETVSRAQMDVSSQIESLRQEVARLRGQIEVLTRDLSEVQRRQRDGYAELDSRLKKNEPQAVVVDGKQTTVENAEKTSFDASVEFFRNGQYKDAVAGFTSFLRQYSHSSLAPGAQFYIGSAYFALRDWRAAIAQQQTLVKTWPDNPRAPDGLLIIASSQIELNDLKAAKATLERIVKLYPSSPAAETAKERLASLK